jgi:nucleotide-binding universal stress UspA family protein
VAHRSFEPYRQILVPVTGQGACDEATAIACRLAADRGAVLTLLTVVEVVRASTRVVRARSAAEAIVRCAAAGDAEVVVLGAPRRRRGNRRAPVFGRTVGAVLAQAPCRVVAAR